ncbi:MAG: hypothetical protein LBR43_01705 [Spiroplasmataceae bacterium]|nr:hypothetical protein [Spiroplasmataceae bacterium]
MTTINLELNLNKKKLDLLEKLEKNTGEKRNVFLTEILNGETTWEDLVDFNYVLEWEKQPNKQLLSGKEADEYLDNLFLTNPNHNRKHHHDLQS